MNSALTQIISIGVTYVNERGGGVEEGYNLQFFKKK